MQSSRHGWYQGLSAALCCLALLATTTRTSALADTTEPSTTTGRAAAVPQKVERRVILFVRTPGDEATLSHLRFELRDANWRVLEIESDDFTSEPLSGAAEREQAAAAVRVDVARSSVELWVRQSEGSISETFTARGERARAQVLAVRVAEALRARGLLIRVADRAESEPARGSEESSPAGGSPEGREPGEGPVRANPGSSGKAAGQAVASTVADTAAGATDGGAADLDAADRRFHSRGVSVEFGPGLALSPGGLGPLALVEVGARLGLGRAWSLCMLGMIPLSHQSLRGAEGSAEVSSFVAGGLLEYEWAHLPFGGVRSGLGGGIAATAMSGKGASGFEGEDDTVTVATPLARTSFHLDLVTWLRLRTAIAAGATFPAVRVAFGARDVANWGRPFVIGSLALEVSPP